jgi:hypothetical protein
LSSCRQIEKEQMTNGTTKVLLIENNAAQLVEIINNLLDSSKTRLTQDTKE